MQLTLASILTDPGSLVIAAALITGVIALSKNLVVIGPRIDDGNEPTVAFGLSAVLVVLAAIDSHVATLPAAFSAFLAFYGIAQVAMGVHKTVTSARQAVRSS